MKISVNGKVVTIKCETEEKAKGLAWGITKAQNLVEEGNLDNAMNIFKKALSEDADKIYNLNLKVHFQSMLTKHIYKTRINKTKSIILNLGFQFARLKVSDIVEKCGEQEDLIISIIQDMVKNREISAKYFKTSKDIAFNPEIDVEEIDNLIKSFEDWEK